MQVHLEPTRVVKCFPKALFQRAKDHVEVVYKVLEEHAIPNVDRLDHADQNAKRLIFKPRGQERRPANLVELFHALTNVLQALVKLHAASWMHRDIRWPNVMKSRDGENSWFLIDFMDATQSPQVSPPESIRTRPRDLQRW
jgi:aminoglycoside/choline kinase family phosphotransferase